MKGVRDVIREAVAKSLDGLHGNAIIDHVTDNVLEALGGLTETLDEQSHVYLKEHVDAHEWSMVLCNVAGEDDYIYFDDEVPTDKVGGVYRLIAYKDDYYECDAADIERAMIEDDEL